MKISELIAELKQIKDQYGDIEVNLQNEPKPEEMVTSYESFFLVPEEYSEPKETILNIRSWPY